MDLWPPRANGQRFSAAMTRMDPLNLNDIALFVHVLRYGSFAEAGRQLGLPSNTVSRRIQDLESQLGVRLLQRSTRKLTPTGAGQALHARCADAVDGLFEASQDLMLGREEPRGVVRVAASADFFDFFAMPWVAGFLQAHPRVSLDFVLSDAKTDLIAERIDVAFRGGAMEDSGHVGRAVLPEGEEGWVASPAYLAARGVPTTLAELATHAFVAFSRPGRSVSWRMRGPDGSEDEIKVTPCFSANTAQVLRKATLAGIGIALLPRPVIRRDLDAGLVVPVLPGWTRRGRGLHVLYPSRRHLPAAVTAFIDLAVERLRELEA